MHAWIEAEVRGFHHGRPRDVDREYDLAVASERRVHGVYDPTAAHPEVPVATVDGWPTGLSVPGGRSVDAWAVSAVTVSPTHRRRGIARALMEGELVNARNTGAALAMLTVTEATIYGRYGYAPAARAATVTVDRRRVHWVGPDAPGRVQFVAAADLRKAAPAIARRAVARTPGEIDRWPGILDRALGLVDADGTSARAVRTVRYDDEHGQPQGFVAYRIAREPDQPGIVEFDFLVAATDDAERALWRFLIEQDFVSGVRGRLRSVDEPLPWLLEDPRAVTFSDIVDHLWVRILDPVQALGARRYGTRWHPRARGLRPAAARARTLPADRRRARSRRGRASRRGGCRGIRPGARTRRAGARRDLPRRRAPLGARAGGAHHGAEARGDRAGRPHVRGRAHAAPQHLVLIGAASGSEQRSIRFRPFPRSFRRCCIPPRQFRPVLHPVPTARVRPFRPPPASASDRCCIRFRPPPASGFDHRRGGERSPRAPHPGIGESAPRLPRNPRERYLLTCQLVTEALSTILFRAPTIASSWLCRRQG